MKKGYYVNLVHRVSHLTAPWGKMRDPENEVVITWIVIYAECSTNQSNLRARPSYNSDYLGLLTTSGSLKSEKSRVKNHKLVSDLDHKLKKLLKSKFPAVQSRACTV